MTVLSVAYPLFPVGPDSSGGAEQILYLVEREIVRAGHRSLVVASEGSRISGELIATTAPNSEMEDAIRRSAELEHFAAISGALKKNHIDVIHFHGLDFAAYLPMTAVAKLVSLHLPLSWYAPTAFDLDDVNFVCVSESQAAGTRYAAVTNGIDLARYTQLGPRVDGDLLWLGRICPEKGVHFALQVAHALDLNLKVAGPVHDFETHQRYFREQVAPLLDAKRRYLGPVAGELKSQLLSGARCLLVPSLAPETSSLVAMEAISAGTPVVAFRSGALPEVVENGVTGYIVDSEEAMCAAVKRVNQISPAVCRETAVRRFDSCRMASEYINMYRTMLTGR